MNFNNTTPTAAEIFAALRAPFDPAEVKWRIGSKSKDGKRATMLAYIDARHVQDRLDEVVGPMNWRQEYMPHAGGAPGGIMCALSVRVDGEWITKIDAAEATDIEGAKGGPSDAFKRAAVQFGIGRYLYAVEAPWVELENGYPPRGFDGRALLDRKSAKTAQKAAPAAAPKAGPVSAAPAAEKAPAPAPAKPAAAAQAKAPATAAQPAAPAPAAAPAAAPAPASALTPADEQALAGLTDDQRKRAAFVIEKARTGKTAPSALRHFVTGERCADMPQAVRDYMLSFVARGAQ